MRRIRFRTRTLLFAVAATVVLAGGLRWWHDARIAEYERQEAAAEAVEAGGAKVLWTVQGPEWLGLWRLFDKRLLMRATHAYLDQAHDDDVGRLTQQLGELGDLSTTVVLARQIIPHARAAYAGSVNQVIDNLRRGNIKHLVVDASVRGAPLEFDAPLYTRDDLEILKATLPELEIVWIEVN